jgi:hypothetical protein
MIPDEHDILRKLFVNVVEGLTRRPTTPSSVVREELTEDDALRCSGEAHGE